MKKIANFILTLLIGFFVYLLFTYIENYNLYFKNKKSNDTTIINVQTIENDSLGDTIIFKK